MTTPNLALAQVDSNSLQPSVPINSALQILDAVVQLVVQDKDLTTPPTTVAGDAGKVWIVGASATGSWASQDGKLALCTAANTWTFITPKEGWRASVIDETDDPQYRYTGTSWELVSGGGGASSTNTVTALSIASGAVNIDCSLGDYFTLAMTANVTSVTFSNLPAAGTAQTIMVQITQDGTGNRTMTMPSSFDWASGTVGTLSTAANARDVLALTTFDQGTTWNATLSKAHA